MTIPSFKIVVHFELLHAKLTLSSTSKSPWYLKRIFMQILQRNLIHNLKLCIRKSTKSHFYVILKGYLHQNSFKWRMGSVHEGKKPFLMQYLQWQLCSNINLFNYEPSCKFEITYLFCLWANLALKLSLILQYFNENLDKTCFK